MSDLKFAIRQMFKSPGVTLVNVLTLAIAIGATTAIYSAIETTILDPLPVKDADRLMYIESFHTERNRPVPGVSVLTIEELRSHRDVFSDLVVHAQDVLRHQGNDSSEMVLGSKVTDKFFSLWGIQPQLGRTFAAEEAQPGSNVIMLSHALWQSRFGGAPEIVGKTVEFQRSNAARTPMFYTVVGVMPKHFVFPYQNVQFWTPLADPKALSGTGGGSNSSRAEFLMHDSLNIYLVSARLADRVSRQQAQALLDAINARQINLEIPGLASRKGWMMRLRPMSAMFADEATREKLWTLFAGIALVWLIACANVANLLAARAEARQHEMAMRVVLGAGRARLMRQTLTECLLLALVGGVCGLLLTGWGVAALDTLLAGIRLKPLALNWPVFATAMAISAVTGIVFGLIPARRASRPKVFETLKQTGAASTQVARGRRFVGGLILGEIALAVVLLAGAGLTIRSLINILTYDFGYDAKNLIELRLTAPAAKYANDPAALQGLATRLNERLANLPGIAAIGTHATDTAGESASFSLAGGTRFRADGSADAHAVVQEFAGLDALDPFKAMGVRLIEGRPLDRSDVERRTVVVNESLARRFWPGQSALGQRLRPASAQDGDGALEVVGIVSDIRRIGGDLLPQQNAPLTLYRPIPDPWVSSALPTMYLRTTIDPVAIIPSLQQALSEVEPDLVGRRITVVSDALAMATQGRRYFMGFLIAFAAVGLTLAVIGLYGLMAFNVQRRTREFGVRMALGATGREVLLRVTGDGVKLAGLGLALGLVLAFPAMRLIQNQLYGVTSSDPLTLLVVVLVLLATAATASFIPARRAARIHPMEALRCE